MGVEWSHFNKYEDIVDQYMPDIGEGETLASQAVTAINKIVYKWYNDGDVYDNTGHLTGWANDLSSYANWLLKYVSAYAPQVRYMLKSVHDCRTDDEYEDLLADLASAILNPSLLSELAEYPAENSIYECDGPFEFTYRDEDEEYGEYYDQEYDDDFDDYDRDYEDDEY